jgi:leucine-rich repeat protein SHOC2
MVRALSIPFLYCFFFFSLFLHCEKKKKKKISFYFFFFFFFPFGSCNKEIFFFFFFFGFLSVEPRGASTSFFQKIRKRRVERLPVFEVSGERERVLLGQVLLDEADTTTSVRQRILETYKIQYACRMYRWNAKGFKELPAANSTKKAHAFFSSVHDKLIVTSAELEPTALPQLFAAGPREVELLRVTVTVVRNFAELPEERARRLADSDTANSATTISSSSSSSSSTSTGIAGMTGAGDEHSSDDGAESASSSPCSSVHDDDDDNSDVESAEGRRTSLSQSSASASASSDTISSSPSTDDVDLARQLDPTKRRPSDEQQNKLARTRCDVTFRGHTFSTPLAAGYYPEFNSTINLGFMPPACRDVISFALVSCDLQSSEPDKVLSRVYLGVSDVVEPGVWQHELRLRLVEGSTSGANAAPSTSSSAPAAPVPLAQVALPGEPRPLQRSSRGSGVLVVVLKTTYTVLNAPDGGDLPLEQRALGSGGGIVGDIGVSADVESHDPSSPNLILTNKSLRVIPERVFRFDRLQILSLQNNAVAVIPSRIGALRSLRVLRLWSNALTSLPDELEQLPFLETLDIGRNAMTQLPSVVTRLTALVDLQCHWNQITHLPPGMSRLVRLATLNVSINRISDLPTSMSRLTRLRNLELSHNEFRHLPDCICDGMQESLEVLLASGNLLKALPTRFTRLAALQSLDLGSNRLLGLPTSIERLSSLRVLSVRNNAMKTLPSKMRGLKLLREVNCSLNRLTSIGGLTALGSLERLFCWKNKLDSFPETVSALTSLITLDASDNMLTRLPSSFGGLKALRMCQLARNRLTALPSSMCKLIELVDLGVFDNRLESLPTNIGRMSALQSLRAESNFLQELPESMSSLRLLAVLDVGNNLLQEVPQWLPQLSSIVSLNLFANRVTARAPLPAKLGSMARLSSLYLSYCNLGQKWADGAVDAIATSLNVLHLDGNDLYRLPTGLSALQNLSELHIGSNQLLVLPLWLTRLTRLARLHAPCNKISTMLPVARCTALQELNLSHNCLQTMPSDIQYLRSLVDLDVSNNEIKALPSELRALPRLMLLKVSDNRCTPKHVHSLAGGGGGGGGGGSGMGSASMSMSAARWRRPVPVWIDCSFAKQKQKKTFMQTLSRGAGEAGDGAPPATVGWAEMNGRRPSQEDSVLVLPAGQFRSQKERQKDEPADALFAVFDGHGGARAAQFCSEAYPDLVRTHLAKYARTIIESPPESPTSAALSLSGSGGGGSTAGVRRRATSNMGSTPSVSMVSFSATQPNVLSFSSGDVLLRSAASSLSSSSSSSRTLPPNPSAAEVLSSSSNSIETSEDDGGGGGGAASMSVQLGGRGLSSPRSTSQRTTLRMSTSMRQLLNVTRQWLVAGDPNALVTAPAHFNADQCPVDYEQCFVQSFRAMSKAIDDIGFQEGAAAVSAYVSGQLCVMACAGDARAVLFDYDGAIRATTFDHKPHSLREMDRIRAAGGFVTENGRVNGTLGLSRAVGDGPFQPMVTHTPDIVLAPLEGAPCCLVLACDGVWDVMTRRQVWALVAPEKSAPRAAAAVRDYAHCMGSTDNISVVVVFLNDFNDDETRARYGEAVRVATARSSSGRGSGNNTESRSASMSSSAMRRHPRVEPEHGLTTSGGKPSRKVRHRVRRSRTPNSVSGTLPSSRESILDAAIASALAADSGSGERQDDDDHDSASESSTVATSDDEHAEHSSGDEDDDDQKRRFSL